MRLDKFLKNARIIKRRTVAKEAAESGRVKVNDKIAKPGVEISVNDIVEVTFGNNIVKFEVLQIIENPKKDEAEKMFRVIS
ncbi:MULTISPECIES: RNA-binding S4 domain-containing protein [Helcococcus]|uniref:RQC P-site tRNA stabilizing factor n=1 Tax=Helcococcus bovis TaxID=3153252 RepID=A0ABW9F6S3_9FIRM